MKLIIFILFCAFVLTGSAKDVPSYLNSWDNVSSFVLLLRDKTCTKTCSGAFIHAQWILTSAICAFKVIKHEMRITFYNSKNTSFSDATFIQNVYSHPLFNSTDLENDIALIELTKPSDRKFQVLKIPQNESDLVSSPVYILGFSYPVHSYHFSECDLISNKRRVIIINNELCEKYPVQISKNRFCTYKSLASEGDAGAPLVSESFTLVGLVSVTAVQAALWEPEHNNLIMPVTTYTKVVLFRDWIKNVTGLTDI